MFYQADLSSLADARRLADAVLADHKRLDLFISNAGIGSQNRRARSGRPARTVTSCGLPSTTSPASCSPICLLPLLKASAPSRIVNVASLGQHPIDFDDVMITRGYSGSRAYAQSKLSQIMFTIDLAEELKGAGVTVNSLHPATYMNTTMVRAGGITPISTVEQGGEAILHLAAATMSPARAACSSTA